MSTLSFPSSHARARRSFSTSTRIRFRPGLTCEPLESRQLLSTITAATDLSQIKAQPNLQATPLVTSGPTGLSPQQIRTAYGVDQITFSGGTISGDGSGQTIAIVTAFHAPSISSDLAAFDSYYGIVAPPLFTVHNLGGSTTDAGWALETALDVEWAHAIAPGANILLVEAASDSLTDLLTAVNYAKAQPGVSVVSMSWGADEFWGESSYDSTFTTPSGHSGVTFVAASGDSGAWYGPSYPAVSPNVLSIGGTSIRLNSSNTITSESGWSGSTGGFSGYDMNWWYYESAPSYQVAAQQASGLSYGVRTTPDVSFNADPRSGMAVFSSVSYYGQSGWFQLGGTSAGAPAWAGLIAIANQGLATGGKGPLSDTQAQAALYSLPNSDFRDVARGFNGYFASTGYDLVTGLGSPRSNLVIGGLLAQYGVSTAAAAQIVTATTSGAAAVSGTHFVLTVEAGAGSSGAVATTPALASSAAQSTAQAAASLQMQALTTQVTAPQIVSPTAATALTAAPALGQGTTISAPAQGLPQTSTRPDASIRNWDRAPARLVDTVESARPAEATTPAEQEATAPDTEPAPVAPPVPLPVEPAADPTTDPFDLALEAMSRGLAAGRFSIPTVLWDDKDRVEEERPVWSMSALAGTAVIAAGGYRLLLGRSDRIRRRRSSWRFASAV